jgi:hypothetical protein
VKPGEHTCVAYNDGRGTIRVRRPVDKPNTRHMLLYHDTPIDTFDGHPAGWPLPSAQFVLRDHEVQALRDGLK